MFCYYRTSTLFIIHRLKNLQNLSVSVWNLVKSRTQTFSFVPLSVCILLPGQDSHPPFKKNIITWVHFQKFSHRLFFFCFFTSTSKIIAASPPFPPTPDTPIHCASDLLFAQLSGTLLLGTSDFSLNAPFFSGRVCYTDTNRWRETNIRRLTKHRFYARATCCKAITFVQGITGEARWQLQLLRAAHTNLAQSYFLSFQYHGPFAEKSNTEW